MRPRVSRHVNVTVVIAADVAREVIPEVELPSAILAEGLAVELGMCRLAHLSAHLVFKASVFFQGVREYSAFRNKLYDSIAAIGSQYFALTEGQAFNVSTISAWPPPSWYFVTSFVSCNGLFA